MNQPKGSKKRFTVTATKEGIEKAEKALMRLGFESQTNFAAVILMSRSTVSKFFNRKPIQLDSFKRICKELGGLKWQEISGISEIKQKKTEIIKAKDSKISTNKEVRSGSTIQRQVTIIDPQTKTKKAIITLQGDIESVNNIKILQSILREHSGNTIEIQDIQPGSIKIYLEGSPEDIDELISSIKLEKLNQLDTFPIEDIIEVDEKAEIAKTNDKWELVQKIRNQEVKKLDFREIDLSDANLSDADLRGANLRGADLSGVDLSGADLSGANLRGVDLSGADLSGVDLSGAYLKNTKIDENTKLDSKWHKVWEIVNQGAQNQNLSHADLSHAKLSHAYLSGAQLSHADLSYADLSYADLSYADLSGANVENARFGYNSGVSESLKHDLIARGAIFEDSPGDRSGVPTAI